MRFLTLYTAADLHNGTPGPESMAKMGTFMAASIKSGVLIATGSITPSAAGGMRMKLANGKFDLEAVPPALQRRQPGGWAILNVTSLEHLQEVARQFLEVVGDGAVEVMEITQAPMP
jgi:hypothetical protein